MLGERDQKKKKKDQEWTTIHLLIIDCELVTGWRAGGISMMRESPCLCQAPCLGGEREGHRWITHNSELLQSFRQKRGDPKIKHDLQATLPPSPTSSQNTLLLTFYFFHIYLLLVAPNRWILYQLRTFAFAMASACNPLSPVSGKSASFMSFGLNVSS